MVIIGVNQALWRLVAACSIWALSACTDGVPDNPHEPADEIFTETTTLIPNKDSKEVTANLTFDNLDAIDYIQVRKSGAGSYSHQIERQELSTNYQFVYTIQPSDPESFNLVLSAHYRNGNVSKNLVLDVDNRWGFFIRYVRRIARVTGRPLPDEQFPTPINTATTWNVGGTDLGVVWEMSPGEYGIFFGDTFGSDFAPNPSSPGPNGGSWRCNVLGFSSDTKLDDGLTISRMAEDNSGNAREIIYGGKDDSGNGNWTSIPTAAIRANGVDYVHYFNIKSWTGWVTNYSGMYKSEDSGATWTKCDDVVFGASSPFGQAGYFKKDGYVYMMGTETGRDSPARLARFTEMNIENLAAYEYWNGAGWVKGDETQATVLIDDKVGELSFIYNETHQKWIVAYFNADRYNITMRTATELTGPWSEPYELAAGKQYAQLYGSYIHPLSVTGDSLYFLMSMWLPYNVFLMKAELADMGKFSE